jgi:pimeloyl-ACP methyl ester carboxylesterase
MDQLGIAAAHVISAKIGAAIAIQLAVSRPERVIGLSVVSGVIRKANSGPPERPGDTILKIGTRQWAEDSQRARLGTTASEAKIAWWNDLMGNSNPEACAGYANMMGRLDNYHLLREIKVPTLFLGNERPGADQAASRVWDWQSEVLNSEATIFEAEGYHVAATEPDKCAVRVLEFISAHR